MTFDYLEVEIMSKQDLSPEVARQATKQARWVEALEKLYEKNRYYGNQSESI